MQRHFQQPWALQLGSLSRMRSSQSGGLLRMCTEEPQRSTLCPPPFFSPVFFLFFWGGGGSRGGCSSFHAQAGWLHFFFLCQPFASNRYLLSFGTVSDYLGYNALSDFFPQYTMKPNPDCALGDCCHAQSEYEEKRATEPTPGDHDDALPPGVHRPVTVVVVCVCVFRCPFFLCLSLCRILLLSLPLELCFFASAQQQVHAHCPCACACFSPTPFTTFAVVHEETFGICVVDESEPAEDTSTVAPGLRYEHDAAQCSAEKDVCAFCSFPCTTAPFSLFGFTPSQHMHKFTLTHTHSHSHSLTHTHTHTRRRRALWRCRMTWISQSSSSNSAAWIDWRHDNEKYCRKSFESIAIINFRSSAGNSKNGHAKQTKNSVVVVVWCCFLIHLPS